MKKGVVASIVLSVVLTLTLAITTIATAFGGTQVPEPSVYLAYRTGDVCTELNDYESINFNFDVNNSASMIVYNSENGQYEANAEGKFVGTAVKTNGRECDITIEVFEQGDGSAQSPWVIANAGHLVELSELASADEDVYGVLESDFVCEVKADVDMKDVDFKPIGNRNKVFKGTINGNGKTISNLSISIDENNYQDYLVSSVFDGANEGYLDVALISNANGATINALNIGSMNVVIAENVKSTIENQISASAGVLGIERLRRVTIGGLVAYATDTKILGDNSSVSITVNGYSYANDFGGAVSAGVGGVVGVARGCVVENYTVNSRFTANQTLVEGSLIGGVAGFVTNSTNTNRSEIKNVTVTLTANTVYNNNTQIAGIVGEAYNADISDSTISGISVLGNEKFDNVVASQINTEVAGAVIALGNGSTLTNVNVANAGVDVKGFVAGIVVDNNGTVENCSFKGNLTGYSVAGIVTNNASAGQVIYDETFTGIAVQGNLRGVRVGGVAETNKGALNGTAGSEMVIVSPTITSVSAVVTNDEAVTAIREAFVAGLAVENIGNGEISNFKVIATLYDGLNMAGLVSIMGSEDGTSLAQLHDIVAQVSISSNNLTSNNSTTYSIGGAVGFAYKGSSISGISLSVNVNRDALASRNYGVAQLGGLAARIYDDGVTITNNTVSGYMFANTTWYTTTITDSDGSNAETYNTMLVGGLIGSIAGFGDKVDDNNNPIDAHTLIDITSATIISGNSIENLEIVIDFVDNGVGEHGSRVRSIGSFVGSVANASGALNLSNNTINGLTISANRATFSYGNICYIDDGMVHVYGSANISNIVTEPDNSNIVNRKYNVI